MAVCGISSTNRMSSGSCHLAKRCCQQRGDAAGVGRAALAHHHDQHRALAPFRMRHADGGGLGDVGVGDGGVLELDRADPFAAGLDHVLGAVGDAHVAVARPSSPCRRCRTSRPASVASSLGLEVAPAPPPARAPRACLCVAAVPGEVGAGVVGDLQLDGERRMADGLLHVEALGLAEARHLGLEACRSCRSATSRSCPRRAAPARRSGSGSARSPRAGRRSRR